MNKDSSVSSDTNFVFDSGKSIHAQIQEFLLKKIQSMRPGEKMPTERKLSEYFQVARATVSRALDELEQNGHVIRHQGRGTFVKNIINLPADKGANAGTLGLIIPDIEDAGHARIMKGVEQEALKRGYNVQVSNLYIVEGLTTARILKRLKTQDISGLILYPVGHDPLDNEFLDAVREFMETGKRLVLVDQYIPSIQAPTVMVNKVRESYIATQHLIMLGHHRICYVSTAGYDVTGYEGLRGHRQALQDYGLEYDNTLHLEGPAVEKHKQTYHAVLEFLRQHGEKCTAFQTPQPGKTYDILHALKDAGKRVPEDYAVVGAETYVFPELGNVTHTEKPMFKMGQEAVKLLLDEKPADQMKDHVLQDPVLVIGVTCQPPSVRR